MFNMRLLCFVFLLFSQRVLHEIHGVNNSVVFYPHDSEIIEYGSICRNATVRTICIDSSIAENFWTCKNYESYDEVCSYETEPRSWEFKCSLSAFYERLPYLLNNTWGQSYWYPARRYVKYGPYEFAIYGKLFGQIVSENIEISFENVENMFEKDCLVRDSATNTIAPEYCAASHKHNCTFLKNDQIKYCSSNCATCINSYTCLSNITTNYCVNSNNNRSSYPEVDHAENYVFCPAHTDVQQYEDLFCPACFKHIDYCPDNAYLGLSFNELNKKLRLVVYSPECLTGKGDPDYIYCFTDASDYLRKRIHIIVEFNNTSLFSNNNFIVYDVRLETYIGNYWCEATSVYHDYVYKSNTVLAYKIKRGNEFAVRLKINRICDFTDCTSNTDVNFLIDDIRQPLENAGFSKMRIMKIFDFHQESFADLLFHISSLSHNRGILNDYYKLLRSIQALPNYIEFIYCQSSEYCLPENYQNLTWPFAKIHQTVLPIELCTQWDGSLVTRFCQGNFLFGLEWGSVQGNCSNYDSYHEDTKLLASLVNQNLSEGVISNVSKIIHKGNMSITDLYFVSQILDKIANGDIAINSSVLNASLDMVDGLLKLKMNTLATAQEKLNLTDSYLRNTEIATINLIQAFPNSSTFQKDYVIVHHFNPILQNASGFALYKNLSIASIPLEGDFTDVKDIHEIKLALYIPSKDMTNILAQNLTNVSIIAIIYLNDYLFPSNSNKTTDIVVNLNIPNYESYLQSPLPLLVNKNLSSSFQFNCAFWDYSQMKKGNWSYFGSTYDGIFNSYENLRICSYSHLTHLALLFIEENSVNTFNGTNNDRILTLITAVGSLLSTFGILGIFLTALVFSSWRNKTGTQILMHLSIATLLEIIFMYLNGSKLFDCIISGCILQYVIVSKFAWMLIYAVCQYFRFVRVFSPVPNHLVLKSVIFGWGFGLVPVIPVILSDPYAYYKERFCYPGGISLYLGVYLPIAIVLIINVCIFFKIMIEVTNNKFDKVHPTSLKLQQAKLAILLFSVLGIPWIFGLLSVFTSLEWLKLIFLYLFTATSIFQGFLMFLFYVLLNQETRTLWSRAIYQKRKTYENFSSKTKNYSVTSIS